MGSNLATSLFKSFQPAISDVTERVVCRQCWGQMLGGRRILPASHSQLIGILDAASILVDIFFYVVGIALVTVPGLTSTSAVLRRRDIIHHPGKSAHKRSLVSAHYSIIVEESITVTTQHLLSPP